MEKSKQDRPLDSKQIFLLLFARELIRNSEEGLLQLKRILEESGQKAAKEMKLALPASPPMPSPKNLKEELPMMKSILSEAPRAPLDEELSAMKPVHIKSQTMEISSGYSKREFPVLRIPEPKLPPEFQHLMPVPSRKEIDLDKLNPLIGDPAVRKIECDGPNKPIAVSGTMGRKPTQVALTNIEIDDMIERFAKAARIPVDIGVFRVVVGNLILTAVISDIVPSRFTITKVSPSFEMNFRPRPVPMPPPVNMPYSNYIKQ